MRSLLLATLLLGCAHGSRQAGEDPSASKPKAPQFDDLGAYHRGITTRSSEAQKFFDQGLILVYGFNHDEAIHSFSEAARLDPTCAMCFWGVAYANGPHINNPILDPGHAQAAYEAVQKAKAAMTSATDRERAFIGAVSQRYSSNPQAERGPLDLAYANAMREVWKQYPDDPDAGTLFAEALMDLRPWDFWTHDGKPQPGTEEMVAALEVVLSKVPGHPGANHFYIHAVEASPHPERALASADRLGKLVPGAGHLVHMPSHVYIRVGRYYDAAETNKKAIEVDRQYQSKSGPQGFYTMYIAHNFQFLWAAAMWAGSSAEAVQALQQMQAIIPPEMGKEMPEMMDLFMPYPYYTLLRFGRLEQMLNSEPPSPEWTFTNAMWHYGRGLAFTLQGNLDEAAAELEVLDRTVPKLSDQAVMVLNPPRSMGTIALHHLAGELAARRGNLKQAVRELKQAVAAEDTLHYNEPPDWMLPVRHSLGKVLLDAGKPTEAEAVYREDLQKNPDNGWALLGLAQSLKARKSAEAPAVEQQFRKAWEHADFKLSSSRF